MPVVNLKEKFSRFSETWTPHVVAELNGQQVKVAKLEGEFLWHDHEHEDELFWVVAGRLRIELRDRDAVELGPGELFVVPRGTEHRPVALPTAQVVLFEPASTAHTGAVVSERTVQNLKRI
ncbi:cupin domain-containing protein [Rubrivirga sp. S365]|uniref:Cupin domain-containing protein n=1 Tax=Rubrivirga litoralis TaxID=3075598 RepID=A0ABU3BSM9_9BACT|nr:MULTISPECIES: cupin domain-containing protein [unclassified Rubrivirga]MDT0632284.1 cupin domain-containing protein [Rubrivirga sp. F394]MDT7856331.1 cupin domain-containing protein [Rubrivirga sp. S365]